MIRSQTQAQEKWQQLHADGEGQQWDLLVVGGGIVGVSVLREAARRGLKCLLLEQRDFSWGTSSRSSKMVHGGLRYIGTGDIRLTRESVQERQRLLQEAPGLVVRKTNLFAHRRGQFPPGFLFNIVLSIYDLFAGRRDHRTLGLNELELQAPGWSERKLLAASQYTDAVTDDSRLVLRVLDEAMNDGAEALNYVQVKELLKTQGRVTGVTACSVESEASESASVSIHAKVVINATGVWADELRETLGAERALRPLRGSHILLPAWRLPVAQTITFMHPKDKRFVFIFPWEGVTVVGTTDLDHSADLNEEARISREELDYLLQGARDQFPGAEICEADIISSYSGIRSIVGTGLLDPSKEKREHSVWDNDGLITVAGGKLTTFRTIALDVLNHAKVYLPGFDMGDQDAAVFVNTALPADAQLPAALIDLGADHCERLLGRYGKALVQWVGDEAQENMQFIPGTPTLWAELKWTAGESVYHLDDLLLRRTRIGLLLRGGGRSHMPRVRSLCQEILGWDDARWELEEERYYTLWQKYYYLPQ